METIDLAAAVRNASQREEVCQAVHELYQSLEDEIGRRRPVCVISGRCCRFDEYGHRLYVTTLELARFVHDTALLQAPENWDGAGCPYQRAKLCTVHASRPFGCRMFFCDATSTDWQNSAYE